MPPLIGHFRYRLEIDGLRGVAVVAVVLFHSGLGFPGGHVGVAVFFVIYSERRIRHIIPALAAVVPATLIAGWFLLLPKGYAALGKAAAFRSLFAANIHFWMVTVDGYFAGAEDEVPLLHTWSLAAEKPFYLAVPLSLAAIFRFPVMRTHRGFFAVFGSGILLSRFASIYGVTQHPSAAFDLLPTRAWRFVSARPYPSFRLHGW